MCMYVCMYYLNMYACLYERLYVRLYVCMYVCMYVSSFPYPGLDIDAGSSFDEQGNHLGVAIGRRYYKGSPPILTETPTETLQHTHT